MDIARMKLVKDVLNTIISDASSIVIYYAKLTETEKLLSAIKSNLRDSTLGYGKVFASFRFYLRTIYHYNHVWFFADISDKNNFANFCIGFGFTDDVYHVKQVLHVEQVELNDLLPCNKLNIHFVLRNKYKQMAFYDCRGEYEYMMNERMNNV